MFIHEAIIALQRSAAAYASTATIPDNPARGARSNPKEYLSPSKNERMMWRKKSRNDETQMSVSGKVTMFWQLQRVAISKIMRKKYWWGDFA
jgi:hypothetical protein